MRHEDVTAGPRAVPFETPEIPSRLRGLAAWTRVAGFEEGIVLESVADALLRAGEEVPT
jgi:hypothetical protein